LSIEKIGRIFSGRPEKTLKPDKTRLETIRRIRLSASYQHYVAVVLIAFLRGAIRSNSSKSLRLFCGASATARQRRGTVGPLQSLAQAAAQSAAQSPAPPCGGRGSDTGRGYTPPSD
jgi:hypothetical protein